MKVPATDDEQLYPSAVFFYIVETNRLDVSFNNSSLQDLSTRKWTKPNATGSVPLGRRSHSAFVYNKQLYVFGGYNSIMEKHFNDLYCYNPATNRWCVVAARGVPPKPRRRQVCLVIDKRMYLFGGTRQVLKYPQPLIPNEKRNNIIFIYEFFYLAHMDFRYIHPPGKIFLCYWTTVIFTYLISNPL